MEGSVKDLASYRLSTAYVDFHQSLAVIYGEARFEIL